MTATTLRHGISSRIGTRPGRFCAVIAIFDAMPTLDGEFEQPPCSVVGAPGLPG